MQSLWDDQQAAAFQADPLAMRVYTSRLLGRNPDLVLHGGGNTSVKAETRDLFDDPLEVLYVKGSGWDLATIEAPGFAPVRLDVLQRMAQLPELGDTEMVRAQRAAMTDPNAPNPSVEAILHAIIPFRFVDHTHADAVVTVCNTPGGEARIREIYGERVFIIPYVMPGFVLARKVFEMTQGLDWSKLEGLVLMNHGIFSFADDGRESYERMIRLVSQAEDYLARHNALVSPARVEAQQDLPMLARIRKAVSAARGHALTLRWDRDPASVDFSNLSQVEDLAGRGPLTPDHVIRTKRTPVVIGADPEAAVDYYQREYASYFACHTDGNLTPLNPAPCWAVWPGFGTLSFGRSMQEAGIIGDIKDHSIQAIRNAEALGGWRALPEKDIFEVEYWELEQAKLRKAAAAPPLQGQIALVTGAASGIGKACVEALRGQGAAVAAVDLNPAIREQILGPDALGLVCDVTDPAQVQTAVADTVRAFGGLDILVSNAGAFFASETIEDLPAATWDTSLAVNLSAHQRFLQACIPYLKQGLNPAVVMIASKNVPAPGPGAAAYSVAKAGQTQLARVAALELGPFGIRVNTLHPNAVFDTAIWTDAVLAKRAEHYGLTVEQYKCNNLLNTEVRSADVAALACALAGPLFAKTTGAQLPVDGGNERVV